MTAATTILLGPATAGKTTRLVARYRDHLASPGPSGMIGRGLWIAPTYGAVEAVRGRLIAGGLRACLAPNCFTFASFAKAIIDSSAVSMRPLTAMEKRQLIRRLIEQAAAGRRLDYFRPIAHTDGLIDLVSELFSDLKRQEIWPDEFKRICSTLGSRPKDCELADLYERYQLLLNEHRLYDDEGRFWAARDLLGQGRLGPFGDVQLVIVDGFTDFTRTQHEILALLHRRTAEMQISLPWEDGRTDLFQKSTKTLAEMERRLPGARREVVSRPVPRSPDTFAASMAHLEEQLFCDPRRVTRENASHGVEILSAAGQLGEIEMLAQKIKQLLFAGDGPASARVRPEEIAVVFRSTGDPAPLLCEMFSAYGIPFALDCGTSLGRSPLLAALVAVLKLDLEDWPFRQLLKLLANNYFQPRWPQWERGAVAVQVEQAIRSLQIPKGRRALLAALERCANAELDSRASDRRREWQTAARAALALLTQLAATFDRLPDEASAEEWSAALQALADELGMLSVVNEPCELPVARDDAAAWELIRSGLVASADLEGQLDGGPVRLSRRAVLQRIEDLGATEELPREHDDAGRVRILSAPQARALDVAYLFVAGLSEKAFPAADRDNRLYTAADCQQMNRAGLRFVERHERACEEMLLFYEVITRPRRRLWLSYSSLDDAAQPLSASPYVTEVQRLFAAGSIGPAQAPNLSPIPLETEPGCQRDFRIKAISMALDGSARLAGQLWRRTAFGDSTASLAAALRANAERSRRESFGPFEGILLGPAAKENLAARFGTEHCWSTSQLEEYGYCPQQFFLKRVLRLKELEELSLDDDYAQRGRRVHTLLTEVHRQLNAQREPCSPVECDAERFQQLVDDTLAAVIEQSGSDSALDRAFDWIDHQIIARWVQSYLEQYLKYEQAFSDCDAPPKPTYFEVSFGPAKDDEESDPTDPLSKPDAYELVCNGMTIRLAGRVDRIDVGLVDGQIVFNVLDYKTNASAYRADSILDGKKLQLPLYAMAVQDLLLADQNALPWQGGYWQVRDGGFNPKRALAFHRRTSDGIRRTEQWAELRERLVQRVASLVGGIRQGQFPMYCEDEQCTGRCSYKTVCRVQAVRSLEKTWQPPATSL